MDTLKNVLSILGMVGIPSLGSIVIWLWMHNKEAKRKREEDYNALKKGIQAILRAQMISEYNKWHEQKKYAPIWAKDNFENIWLQYESLGDNGVMNEIHNHFISLPTEPSSEEITND